MKSGFLIQENQRLTIFQKYLLIRLQQKLVDKGINEAFKVLKDQFKAKKNIELQSTNQVMYSNMAQTISKVTEVEVTIEKVKHHKLESSDFKDFKDVRILRTHKKKILLEFEKSKQDRNAEQRKVFNDQDEKEQLNQIQNLKNLIHQQKSDRSPIMKNDRKQENYLKEIIISITILLLFLSIMTVLF